MVRGIDDHAMDSATIVALTTCPGLADALAEAGACVLVVPHPEQAPRKDLMRALRDAVGDGGVVVAGDTTLLGAARKLEAKRRGPRITVLDASHEAHVVAAIAASALVDAGRVRGRAHGAGDRETPRYSTRRQKTSTRTSTSC